MAMWSSLCASGGATSTPNCGGRACRRTAAASTPAPCTSAPVGLITGWWPPSGDPETPGREASPSRTGERSDLLGDSQEEVHSMDSFKVPRLRITCVGGGPAGLYFSSPDWEVKDGRCAEPA